MKTATTKTARRTPPLPCARCDGKGFRASRHAANLICGECAGTGMELTSGYRAQLANIARAHLGIETLESRGSDGADFHEVSTWALEAALAAAFEAGRKASTK